MELSVIDLLIKITSTTLPGYFTYYVFQKFNIMNLSPKKVQDNKSILTAFSAINLLIGLMIYQNSNTQLSIYVVGKTMLGLILITSVILPFIVKVAQTGIVFVRKKMNLGVPTFTTNWKLAFDNRNPKVVHIYTFTGDLIYSGEVSKISESNDWEYCDLLFENNLESNFGITEKETLATFKQLESEGCKIRVYLDIEKSLKYYILEYQNS